MANCEIDIVSELFQQLEILRSSVGNGITTGSPLCFLSLLFLLLCHLS
jgi:hypothetical protein